MSVLALFAFALFAVADWVAVGQERKEIEYVAKPATLVALLIWAATGEGSSPWLLAALGLSVLGDVYLMLPGDLFIPGLLAFLLAHVAYIADFEATGAARLVWLVVVLAIASPVVLRIIRAVKGDALRGAVGTYAVVISLMAASALGSGDIVAILGALLFLASDALIAWTRFVAPLLWGKVAIIVTYHLGQFLLATALRSG